MSIYGGGFQLSGGPATGLIGEIDPADDASWVNKWFITIDVDWAHDDVLEFAIDLVEQAGIKATWLMTHDTQWAGRLTDNPLFELGIHPNFNGLLQRGSTEIRGPGEILGDLLAVFPCATSVRSHSITYSSRLSNLFVNSGLTHDLNTFVPFTSAKGLSPWQLSNRQIRVPFGWEDDLSFPLASQPDWSRWGGIRVVNFHPIHLFLNTENMDRYENTRAIHRTPMELEKYRNRNLGTMSVFNDLVEFVQNSAANQQSMPTK